ncbi:MAG: protein-L-isoaspartate(D-aspartate) O-methyltransferase [Pseudomonadota bacterium]
MQPSADKHGETDQNLRKIRLLLKLRQAGISDTRTLAALERVPRDAFVPENFLDQAYDDMALPIGLDQTISQPYVVARMTEALELSDRHKVLEIGTGSGYQTAILSRLCRRVYSIERHKPLLDQALRRLEGLKVRNVTAKPGDGTLGWPEQAPFERIIVTAAHPTESPPRALMDQLAEGGIMIIPLEDQRHMQHTCRVVRTSDSFEISALFPVRFVPLVKGQVGSAEGA